MAWAGLEGERSLAAAVGIREGGGGKAEASAMKVGAEYRLSTPCLPRKQHAIK